MILITHTHTQHLFKQTVLGRKSSGYHPSVVGRRLENNLTLKIVRGWALGTVAGSSNSGEGSRGQGARAKIRGVG